jgi:hypothetical protein
VVVTVASASRINHLTTNQINWGGNNSTGTRRDATFAGPNKPLGLGLHPFQHLAGDLAQFDVAPLGFIRKLVERPFGIAAVQRD